MDTNPQGDTATPREENPVFDRTRADRASRAEKLRACAALLRLDTSVYPFAIGTLLTAGPVSGRACDAAVRRSGFTALGWSVAKRDVRLLAREHRRLFGEGEWSDTAALIPPCACSYLSPELDGSIEDVLASYRETRFIPDTHAHQCPAHISNELDFVAHCLDEANAGDERADALAAHFVVEHLFPWGVVFAAATLARARHPVTRFAGEALEDLLFSELGVARSPETGPQPPSTFAVS